MIKRLFIAFALVVLSLAASAQSMDRDVMLINDGTLFTAESVYAQPGDVQVRSTRYLTLTVQNGNDSKTVVVPATVNGGSHIEPTLAYDNETKTLFVFWEAARGLASDLLFTTYQNGAWGKVTAIDTVDWDLRRNLRIALTRKSEDMTDGRKTSVPEITVHAVWWQEGGQSEWARYAMITLDHGSVASIQVYNLVDFLDHVDPVSAKPLGNELLRHPAVFESANHDEVDAVFGDTKTDKMHRITLRPTINGRIHIPIPRGRELPSPTASVNAVGSVGSVSTGPDDLAYYYSTGDALKYVILKDGAWSKVLSIPINEKLSSDGAVNALRRMLSSN